MAHVAFTLRMAGGGGGDSGCKWCLIFINIYLKYCELFVSSCIPTIRKNKSLLRGSDIVLTRHLSIGSTQKELRVGHHRPACEGPSSRRFTGGPMVCRDGVSRLCADWVRRGNCLGFSVGTPR